MHRFGVRIKSPDRSEFAPEVTRRYRVFRHPRTGEQFIPLRGFKGLSGVCGCQHVYLAGAGRSAIWLEGRVEAKIKRLRGICPDLRVEQLGDREAVISVGMRELESVLPHLGAHRRRQRAKVAPQPPDKWAVPRPAFNASA